MADANLKARPSRTKRTGHIMATLRDIPDAPSTAQLMQPQQPFMPWGHIDLWLATAGFFKAGQRVNVSIDYIRQSLTVTPEYDEAGKAREREAFAIERKAANDELRKAWLAEAAKRRPRKNNSRKPRCPAALSVDKARRTMVRTRKV